MYPTSNEYKIAVQKLTQIDKIQGTIKLKDGSTPITFDDSFIRAGSVTIDNKCVNGENLEFGSVYAGQLTVDIMTNIDRYKLYDAEIELFWYLQLPDSSWETIPLGRYYVTEAVRKDIYVSIRALDSMIKLNIEYDGTYTYGVVYDLLQWVCNTCGIELGMTQAEVEALPNGSFEFSIGDNSCCPQYRDIIAIIAQITATFATVDRQGKLVLVAMSTTETVFIDEKIRDSTEVADFKVEYIGVRCIQNNGSAITSYNEKEEGLVMIIENHPFLNFGTEDAKQMIVDNIMTKLTQYEYTPATIKFMGDPSIECGDMVFFEHEGAHIRLIVMEYTWSYRDTHELKCVGKNPKFLGTKDKNQKQFDNLNKIVESNTTSMINFTNATEYEIGPAYKQIAKIALTKDSSHAGAMLTATILMALDVENEIFLRISFNNVYDDSYILRQSLFPGRHIISFTYPLVLVENSVNTVGVHAKMDTGTSVIETGHVKAQIIGQGLVSASAPWDGNIFITEVIELIEFTSPPITLSPINENVMVDTQIPVPVGKTETIGDIIFTSAEFVMGNFEESIFVGFEDV